MAVTNKAIKGKESSIRTGTPAFSYLRVSGRGQLDGDGFERQRLAIGGYASANGFRVVKEFEERGVPGATEWDDRLAWLEMLALITANGVRTILIEALNRLARDLMVQEHIIADLRKRGITLISAAEPDLCVDDPTRKLLRQMMGAISEYDKAMIVIKLRGSRARARARDGRCEGRKSYGARDGEKDIIDRMVEMSALGATAHKISVELNARGVRARSGGIWHPMVVARILRAAAC